MCATVCVFLRFCLCRSVCVRMSVCACLLFYSLTRNTIIYVFHPRVLHHLFFFFCFFCFGACRWWLRSTMLFVFGCCCCLRTSTRFNKGSDHCLSHYCVMWDSFIDTFEKHFSISGTSFISSTWMKIITLFQQCKYTCLQHGYTQIHS